MSVAPLQKPVQVLWLRTERGQYIVRDLIQHGIHVVDGKRGQRLSDAELQVYQVVKRENVAQKHRREVTAIEKSFNPASRSKSAVVYESQGRFSATDSEVRPTQNIL